MTVLRRSQGLHCAHSPNVPLRPWFCLVRHRADFGSNHKPVSRACCELVSVTAFSHKLSLGRESQSVCISAMNAEGRVHCYPLDHRTIHLNASSVRETLRPCTRDNVLRRCANVLQAPWARTHDDKMIAKGSNLLDKIMMRTALLSLGAISHPALAATLSSLPQPHV